MTQKLMPLITYFYKVGGMKSYFSELNLPIIQLA